MPTNDIHKGQICYVLPFGDPGGTGRPAVVVSGDAMKGSGDAVVCYLTRRTRKRDLPCVLIAWKKALSYVVPKPTTVSADRISPTGDYLGEEELVQLEESLCKVLAL